MRIEDQKTLGGRLAGPVYVFGGLALWSATIIGLGLAARAMVWLFCVGFGC